MYDDGPLDEIGFRCDRCTSAAPMSAVHIVQKEYWCGDCANLICDCGEMRADCVCRGDEDPYEWWHHAAE